MDLPWRGTGTLNLSHFGESLLCGLSNGRRRQPGLFKQQSSNAALLFQESQEKVLDINALVPAAHGEGRCALQSLLKLDGHAVHIHVAHSWVGASIYNKNIITSTCKSIARAESDPLIRSEAGWTVS